GDVRPDQLDEAAVMVEGGLAGEERVEEHADGVEVGALIDGLAEGLLGGEVAGRAHRHALFRGLGERAGSGVVVAGDHLRDAEVEYLDGAATVDGQAPEDVVELDVAMEDPGRVR